MTLNRKQVQTEICLLGEERLLRYVSSSPITINGVKKEKGLVEYYEVCVEEDGFSSYGMPDFYKWVPSRWA